MALIVGNSQYESIYSLRNAVNDSSAIADALERLGFDVTILHDARREEFLATVEAFSIEAEGAEATVFYFAGHGFQLGGANYLVPSDAALTNRAAIEQETLRLDAIIARLQARNRQTLVFLDACRNNPLPESVRGTSDADGLAQIETGSGTFVAFATQPGNVTADGQGENSPFTLALLEHIETPGISISDMMIRVRNSVEERTLHQQTPWDQSSLRSQFYFSPEGEGSEALTDEDRELLMALDPELRKKFEARFGLRIESVEGDEDGAQEQLIPVIQAAVSIEPIVETQEVALAAPAAGERPITGLLQIQSADSEEAQQLPESAAVPAPRPDFTREERAEPEEEVVVARLDPQAGAARAPRAVDPARVPTTSARLPDVISGTRVPSTQETEVASLPSSQEPLVRALPSQASETGRAVIEESARAAATTDHSAAIVPGIETSLRPVVGDHVRVLGQEVVTEEAPVELAALDPAEVTPEPIQRAPEVEEATEQVEIPGDLPRAIQTELARLGCYRSRVDGIWGSQSARALLRYYATKQESPDELEPDAVLYARLIQEETVICTHTERAQPPATTTRQPARQRATPPRQQQQPVARREPAAKPAARSAASAPARAPAAQQPARRSLRGNLSSGVFR